MRKYFLLTSAALLAASTANATTDYAEVTAKATIEVAGTFEFSDLDFGTIVVKQQNEEIILNCDRDRCAARSDDFISQKGYAPAKTDENNVASIPWEDGLYFDDITLQGTKGGELTVSNVFGNAYGGYGAIAGTLIIPSKVVADDYTGTFTVVITKE